MSSAESGFYYLKSRYYDPAICRFINADGLASTGQGFLGCNMFAYCRNNPVTRMDIMGALDENSIGKNNEENIRKFFGLEDEDELPEIEDGCMLLLENIIYAPIPGSPLSIVRGHSVLMDKDKYCEYYYYGVSCSKSGLPYGYEEVKGYVYGVENVGDYSGLFFGATWNSSIDADGGAIAPNGVYSKIISGESLTPSLGGSITLYFSLYKEWQYGEAPINWHGAKADQILQAGSYVL